MDSHHHQEVLKFINAIINNKQKFFEERLLLSEQENLELYAKLKLTNNQYPLDPQDFCKLFKIRLWLLNIIKRQQNTSIVSPHKWQFPLDIIPNQIFSKKMVFILPKVWPSDIIEKFVKTISIRIQLHKHHDGQHTSKQVSLCYGSVSYNKQKHQLYVFDIKLKTMSKQITYECFFITFQFLASFLPNEISLMSTTKTFCLFRPLYVSLTQSFQWYDYLARMLKVQEMNIQNVAQQLVIWCARQINQDCKIYQVCDFELNSMMNYYKETSEDNLLQNLTSRFKLLQHCPESISSLYCLGVLFFAGKFEVVSFLMQKNLMDHGLIFIDADKITRIAWHCGKNLTNMLFKIHNVDLISLTDLSFIKRTFGISKIIKLNRFNGIFYTYDVETRMMTKDLSSSW